MTKMDRAAINRELAMRFEPSPKFDDNGFPIRESLCWIGAFDASGALLRTDPQDFFARAELNQMVMKMLPGYASHVVIQFSADGGFAIDMHYLDKQTERHQAAKLEDAVIDAYVKAVGLK
jgi:hypothetical protein